MAGGPLPAFPDLFKPIDEILLGSARAGGVYAAPAAAKATLSERRRSAPRRATAFHESLRTAPPPPVAPRWRAVHPRRHPTCPRQARSSPTA
jgi:hypothetical protein